MALIEIGTAAPDFKLKDQHGRTHALKDYRGRVVVLYFYPEDDTPLCTAQACQFRDHFHEFSKIKAAVVGVSPQDVASKKVFVEKHALPFTVLADDRVGAAGPEVCVGYGVWSEKNMYGKIVRGMLRTTYVIDEAGKVAARFDRVKTPGHAAKVLDVVRRLHAGEKLGEAAKGRVKGAKSKKTTRTQGGHPGYSGVKAAKGGKARTKVLVRKTAVRAGARG